MEKGIYTLESIAKEFNIIPKIIFELGARDGEETLGLSELFNSATIYSFECNPKTIDIWKNKVKGNKKINCIEAAVSDKSGKIKFYPTTKESKTTWEDGNPGASSLFKASGKYKIESYVQKEIEVDTISLRDFMQDKGITNVDILWMDIQGAEGLALKGLGKNLSNVSIIYTEVEFIEIYKGQALYKDIKRILSKDFLLYKFVNYGFYSSDCIFVNKKVLENKGILKKTKFISCLLGPYHSILSFILAVKGFLKNRLIKNK